MQCYLCVSLLQKELYSITTAVNRMIFYISTQKTCIYMHACMHAYDEDEWIYIMYTHYYYTHTHIYKYIYIYIMKGMKKYKGNLMLCITRINTLE